MPVLPEPQLASTKTQDTGALGGSGSKFTGTPITLDFKDGDLHIGAPVALVECEKLGPARDGSKTQCNQKRCLRQSHVVSCSKQIAWE